LRGTGGGGARKLGVTGNEAEETDVG